MDEPTPPKLKKVATWYNDGTPDGRWEWEPGEDPPPVHGPGPLERLIILWLIGCLLLWLAYG